MTSNVRPTGSFNTYHFVAYHFFDLTPSSFSAPSTIVATPSKPPIRNSTQ